MTITLAIARDLAVLSLCAWWLYKMQPADLRRVYWPALAVKLLGGAGVGWLYFYYYGQGDTIGYWSDGNLVAEKIISDPAGALQLLWKEDDPGLNGLLNKTARSLFFVKITAILSILCDANYWMMSITMSFVAFLAAWHLYKRIVGFFPSSGPAAAVSFLFFPSVTFWGSGLIKETLGLASLYFLAAVLLSIFHDQRPRVWELALALLSFWVGWSLKYYWLGIFIPTALAVAGVMIVKRLKPESSRFELILWPCFFLAILLLATGAHPNFYLTQSLEVIWQNNQEFMRISDANNSVHYTELTPTASSMVLNAPRALLAGLFRPFVWESHNLISFVAGLENLVVLTLVLTALPSLPRIFNQSKRVLILAVLVYAFLLATFLALATPNLGTLSRYKIGFLPFLVFVLLHQKMVQQLVEKLTWGRQSV